MHLNLSVYSYYSFLESTLSINDIIKLFKESNKEYAILTDKNLYGSYEFYNKCKKANIKPIIGLEIKYFDSEYILYAKNYNGYSNLIKISSFIKCEKEFELNSFIEDVFIVLKKGNNDSKTKIDYKEEEMVINTVRYEKKEDYNKFLIISAIKENKNIDLYDITIDFDYSFKLDNNELKNVNESKLSINENIINNCNLIMQEGILRLPKFKTPNEISSKTFLENLCIEGLKIKLGTSLIEEKYVNRLYYELNLIDKMGFNDYFLIVYDFVNYAKDHNIMIGPGRGSAAGSLVSYALHITNLDPIKYNLIFERFLNPERKTMPDIDIDVMDIRRQDLIDYIFNKYGLENTSYIITFQRMKIKMAIRDVGRVLMIPLPIIDKISKLLPSENDEQILNFILEHKILKDLYVEYKDLFDIAISLIGSPRQFSTHAAGIIISDKPLYNYMPLQKGIDGWQMSQLSSEFLEPLGLIKIDILGLKNLTIISNALKVIKKNKNIDIDINNINLKDQKIYNEISLANTIGIFQLESPGMRNTLKKIKPKTLEDISIVSAMFRPGPQMMINDYVKTRNGDIKPKYINDAFEELLSETLGFCVYQEQVIEIVKIITGFSTSQADIFRRAISKKQESFFIEMKKEFIEAAIKNKYSSEQANIVYNYLIEFANYGFNHSHSLSYSLISYQMSFLKFHYPLEFFLTLLIFSDSSGDRNNLYISEAKKSKIKIYNVCIKNSNSNFSFYNNGIMFGFINIKGFGVEICKRIIDIRKTNKFEDYQSTISSLGRSSISEKNIEILIKIGAFDCFDVDRNFLLLNYREIISKGNIISPKSMKPLFDVKINNDFIKMSEIEKTGYELNYLDYVFSNKTQQNIFLKYKEEYELETMDSDKKEFNILIRINFVKLRNTKFENKMAFIQFFEDDLEYECASFDEKIFNILEKNKYYICTIKNNDSKYEIKKVLKSLEENEV